MLKKELNNITIKKSNTTEFISPYSEKEKEAILNCLIDEKANITNEINIRLDSIDELDEKIELQLSRTSFYDLLTTNLSVNCNIQTTDKVKNLFTKDGQPKTIENLLSRNYLSNALAVSVLIRDKNGYYLFSKRNSKVAISPNITSVSVTGAVNDKDFEKQNPILSCVKRETYEELGLILTDEQINIKMIVAGEKKLQPVVLCDVIIQNDLTEITKKANDNKKYLEENTRLSIVPSGELLQFLKCNKMTEAAIEHVLSQRKQCGGKLYIPNPINLTSIKIPKEINSLIEIIAENVHDTWAKKRINEGWVYGSMKNDNKKTTPNLVPYEELPESEKEYDRNTAMQTIKMLYKLGYVIAKK